MKFRFISAAETEFSDAVVFYEKAEKGLGEDFVSALLNTVQKILRFPDLGTPVGSHLRAFPMRRFPFKIIHKIDLDEIVIVAVAHQSRRPQFWHDRL